MLKFPPTDLRSFPPSCPCADCLEGVLPRDPRDSRGNPNHTATDLYVMKQHVEYLEKNESFVWLLCGRHWIHQSCAKRNFLVFESKDPNAAMCRLPCWLCGQMDEHRRQLAEIFATWDVEAAASEAVAGNSLPGTPTEDERMPMTPEDYSRDEDASEETSNDDCNEWFEAFEGHAPANSPMVRMPPVANAKGKGKAKGKTNAKAKGKAKGEAKVRPAGRLKPKRKANASVVIDTSPTTPPLPLKVCTRGMRANLKIGSRSCRFLK